MGVLDAIALGIYLALVLLACGVTLAAAFGAYALIHNALNAGSRFLTGRREASAPTAPPPPKPRR